MAEKCSAQLPAIRCTDTLEMALMRLAAREDRKLTDYLRRVLERHAFGHAGSLPPGDAESTDFGALQCSTSELGGRGR